MTTRSPSTQKAVNDYLDALEDPSVLTDPDEVAALTKALEEEAPPAERVLLRSKLRKAKSGDISEREAAFISVARDWAEENGVTAEDWQDFNIPSDVLRAAGIKSSVNPTRTGARRSRRVSADEVEKAIPTGAFKVSTLAELSGASPASAKNVLIRLVEAGKVKSLGPDPSHNGRGRAATLYEKV